MQERFALENELHESKNDARYLYDLYAASMSPDSDGVACFTDWYRVMAWR